MSEFFTDMSVLERILWYIAIPFSLVLILQTLLTVLGAGSDDLDTDQDFDPDDSDIDDEVTGFKIFTVRNFIAFFTFFGWTGIVMLRSGASDFLAVLLAVSAGFVAVAITISFFIFITKMTESGNIDYKNAIGKSGIVYLTIPPDMQGKGKIEVNVQSSLSNIDAMTKEQNAIKTGESVIVTGVENNVLIVKTKGEN